MMPNERKPSEVKSRRMASLSRLPVFYALAGKRAVVAGGSAAAAWKAELLSAAGAEVAVYAPHVCGEMVELAANPPRGPIVVEWRNWKADDLRDAAIVVGGFDDDESAQAFSQTAHALGIPVNVIDKPQFSDFAFGSIVNRSPLVVGISTDGAAPVFAQAIRAKIEAMLPKGFARWATAAAEWRAAVKASGLSFAGRRRFWQRFTAYAIRHPDRTRVQDHLSRFMAEIGGVGEAVEKGSVILVGAGPGDPELLTLRAVRALQGADVILFDDLVSGDVLDFARREAKKLLVGKTGHGPSCQQSDISALMIGLARQGKRVVRLKGGDPLIFARATEEITACKRAGFDVEIVPGITAAQGAAARLGMPLTERGIAQRLQFITGHASDGRLPADINWQSLIDPKTTTAIYMPKATLVEFNENAIANGLDAATPAIAIARATCPDQVVVKATIGDLPRSRELGGIGGPLLVIVGKVCDEAALVLPERIDGRARLPSAPNSLFLV